tara:strand:+ start:39986 stop:43576 length:3591 start_codon:yes stop_codon:yes gene_type:complete
MKSNINHLGIEFLERLNNDSGPVLVFDGATGTSLQSQDLSSEDFGGHKYEGCNEYLVITNPSSVEKVHKSFLDVGCDVIETNTFGASSIVLAEYGLEDKVYEINKKAASIATNLAKSYSTKDKPRFVAGSIGPTTKLPTLGHIDFNSLVKSYSDQVSALIDGLVDLLLVETCQDPLQIKACLIAIEDVKSTKNVNIPVMVSVTMEATGTMLLGTDIGAVLTILEPFDIQILGLNCATGPEEMKDHIKYLSENSKFVTSCIPNAGLPENVGGVAHYRLTPIELKMQLMHFIKDLGVKVIGGCCGTTPKHINQLVEMTREINLIEDNNNEMTPKLIQKKSAASLYTSTSYLQDKSFLIIGERLNASGSKKVRDLLSVNDWDGLVSVAKSQVSENAHILDVNVDYVGRDGENDMRELVSRLVQNINLPLMLDSTEYQKMESGLKCSPGKSILNSTNYEDGNDRFFKVLNIAKKYGCGLVVGTIDENGMARTSGDKFNIAQRAFNDAKSVGLSEEELFFDPLALPISTGIEEDRKNAKSTIQAIKLIRENMPNVHIVLGVSNISFGLNQSARITLNSVFLDLAYKSGLDTAIISPSKIIPLSKIDDKHIRICTDLINDQRRFDGDICTYDPLTELTTIFENVSTKQARSSNINKKNVSIEEQLRFHIIDGEKQDIDKTLTKAMTKYKPLEIINEHLLEGMKVVGELFGSGRMQLPFVLQSAETMKSAVAYLEPYMDKEEGEINSKAKFLIATVKGDVHDIGKNLVDIILTNNGYEVINLGIKQDVASIIEAQKKHKADAIAMSGLLVKSTAFMKENLKSFNESGIDVPVILGGAALTPGFVNKDCSSVYNGIVIYGKDAFTDLRFMDNLVQAKDTNNWNPSTGFLDDSNKIFGIDKKSTRSIQDNKNENSQKSTNTQISKKIIISTDRSLHIKNQPPVKAPFLGSKILMPLDINLDDIIIYLDKSALFAGQWQMKRAKDQSIEEYKQFIENEAEPVLDKWFNLIKTNNLVSPKVVYGYFPCLRNGNSLEVLDENKKQLGQFIFPRQKSGKRFCISDFYSDSDNGITDILPMQAVTMGSEASKYANNLFEKDSYSDYLYFHGLAVQLAEALAEYIHFKVRVECGFPDPNLSRKEILSQKYRGSRFSFGYPACPNVSDSRKQLAWLGAEKIGLSIDESDQLHPEQSTTAIITFHPDARYFTS